jgi:hypothetical protein
MLMVACDSNGSSGAQAAVAAGAENAAETNLSQSGGQQLPPEVGQWVQAGRQDCIDAGGRFSGAADFILRGEFNGDGRTDYLLMGGGLSCSVDLSGREGPRNDFLISQSNGGYALHGGFPAFEVTDEQIARRNDRDVVVLEGTWFRPGGEVHKILWGWNGSEITVVERQDQNGRAVDEEGYPVQGAAAGVSSALPFREGLYGTGEKQFFPPTGEYSYPSTLYVSATEFDGHSPRCRVTQRVIRAAEVRMAFQCEEDCSDGVCTTAPPGTTTIRVLGQDRVSITIDGGGLDYMSGEYTYVGPRRSNGGE